MPEFQGTKVSQDTAACLRFLDVHKVEVDTDIHRIRIDRIGHLGSGRNGGFQALNLAVQFGAKRIVLVAFDMRVDIGIHWHGRHGHGLSNPKESNAVVWRNLLDATAPALKRMGVEVVNASPESALTAFPKMTIEQALTRWE